MEMKLRKLLPLVGAVCLGLTGSAFAHTNNQNGNGSSTYGSSMDSSSSQGTYQRGTFREITPNAGPRVAHGADVFITADFIWWKATEEGMEYGLSGYNGGRPASGDPAVIFTAAQKGKNKSVGEDWAPGFKVGLGLNLAHDGWDLYTQYTWLHASDSNSLSRSPEGVALAEVLPFEDGPSFSGDKASSKWDMHFNVIDLELGRNFYLSQFLTMRPHIGLKATWQDHDWKTRLTRTDGRTFSISYDDANGNTSNFPASGPVRLNKKYDVWGIGVRGGLNVSWYMSKSWSIYGDVAFTSMWTNYHKQTQYLALDDTSTGTKRTREYLNTDNDNIYTCKYIAELELGLRWQTWFYDDNYHFSVQAGWEQQVWINWSKFAEALDEVSHDLALQGLNLKFRFDF